MQQIIEDYIRLFEEEISNDEHEKEELLQGLKRHLEIWVQAILTSESKFISKEPDSIKRVLGGEVERIMQLNMIEKKKCLVEDKSFEQIKEFSRIVYSAACLKFEKKEYEEITEISEMNLNKLLLDVRDYNKEEAENEIKEILAELEYLKSDVPVKISDRLFRYMVNKMRDEDIEM